jgi:hypothetical protein
MTSLLARSGIVLSGLAGLSLLAGCAGGSVGGGPATAAGAASSTEADRYRIVDCLLPGQLRQLGRQVTYVSRPQLIETDAYDCGLRGGEYVIKDMGSYEAALEGWKEKGERGDVKAQLYVADIYLRGLVGQPDYATAATWYRRAAEQGATEAMVNLAILYERGAGVPANREEAARWYFRARGVPEDQLAAVMRGPAPPEPSESAEVRSLRNDLRTAQAERVQLQAKVEKQQAEVEKLRLQAERARAERAPPPVDESARYQAQIEELNLQLAEKDRQIAEIQSRTQRAGGGGTAPTPAAVVPALSLGTYYALVIGNRDYQADSAFPDLANSEEDARRVKDILEKRYGFQVTLLTNANRAQMFQAFTQLSRMAGERDNLLVYYAGHGEVERSSAAIKPTYWIPVDAQPNNVDGSWIPAYEITRILDGSTARHVLVVADSCYAGGFNRTFRSSREQIQKRERIEALYQRRSRQILTSVGENEEALDAIGSRDVSPFAQAFVQVLRENGDVVGLSDLGPAIQQVIISETIGAQTPTFGPMLASSDEQGEFFFVPRGAFNAEHRVDDPQMVAAIRLGALGYNADRLSAAGD